MEIAIQRSHIVLFSKHIIVAHVPIRLCRILGKSLPEYILQFYFCVCLFIYISKLNLLLIVYYHILKLQRSDQGDLRKVLRIVQNRILKDHSDDNLT